MEYILSNTNKECLLLSRDFTYIEVLNNEFLPYPLKDFIQTTSAQDFKKSLKDISVVRDYLAARTLNLSRENAKAILNVASMPQSLRTDDRLKIVFACRGLTMEDNFWIKKAGETLSFKDVNLRERQLSEHSYDVAILGRHISATIEEITPDLMTQGMFPKFWRRAGSEIEMWKTDKTNGVNARAEVTSSQILKASGYSNLTEYRKEEADGFTFSVSKCFTDNDYSLVTATDLTDWCAHTGQKLMTVLEPFRHQFADMCMIDYVLANTDRHADNWGVLVDNSTNKIARFAPIYDMNQSLIADEFNTNIDIQIYEPTGKSFKDSVEQYKSESRIQFNTTVLPEPCKDRLARAHNYQAIEPRGHKGMPRSPKDVPEIIADADKMRASEHNSKTAGINHTEHKKKESRGPGDN